MLAMDIEIWGFGYGLGDDGPHKELRDLIEAILADSSFAGEVSVTIVPSLTTMQGSIRPFLRFLGENLQSIEGLCQFLKNQDRFQDVKDLKTQFIKFDGCC